MKIILSILTRLISVTLFAGSVFVGLFVSTSSAFASDYTCYDATCVFDGQGCTIEDARRTRLEDYHLDLKLENGKEAMLAYNDIPIKSVYDGNPFFYTEHRNSSDLYHLPFTSRWWGWLDISDKRPFNFKGDWFQERYIFLIVNLQADDRLNDSFICETQ